ELVRREEWLRHPNGVYRIETCAIMVERPLELMAICEKLFGIGSATPTDEILTAFPGRHRIMFVRQEDLVTLFPDVDWEEGQASAYAALRLRTADIQAAVRHLEAAGVPWIEGAQGEAYVAPQHANGVLLEFVPEGVP